MADAQPSSGRLSHEATDCTTGKVRQTPHPIRRKAGKHVGLRPDSGMIGRITVSQNESA